MKVFNSKNIIMTVAGKPIKGFSDKGVVKVEYQSPRSELVVGVNEETMFLNNGDLSAKISFSLFQNSQDNFFLNLLLLNPVPVLPVLIRSSTVVKYIGFGIKARLITRPSIDLQKEVKDVGWEILVSDWYSLYLR